MIVVVIGTMTTAITTLGTVPLPWEVRKMPMVALMKTL